MGLSGQDGWTTLKARLAGVIAESVRQSSSDIPELLRETLLLVASHRLAEAECRWECENETAEVFGALARFAEVFSANLRVVPCDTPGSSWVSVAFDPENAEHLEMMEANRQIYHSIDPVGPITLLTLNKQLTRHITFERPDGSWWVRSSEAYEYDGPVAVAPLAPDRAGAILAIQVLHHLHCDDHHGWSACVGTWLTPSQYSSPFG